MISSVVADESQIINDNVVEILANINLWTCSSEVVDSLPFQCSGLLPIIDDGHTGRVPILVTVGEASLFERIQVFGLTVSPKQSVVRRG